MFKLHLKTRVKDVLTDLTMIEEQVKTHPKPSNSDNKKQHLQNPCRLHGTHKWDDCRQNPKYNKSDGKEKPGGQNKNDNGRSRENRCTEANGHQTTRSRSNSRARESDSDYEYHSINNQDAGNKSHTPSSEILIAVPNAETKQFTTYLGLVDSVSSGSLINKEIIKNGNFNLQAQKKPIKWDTATRTLLTHGKVEIKNYCLPQFTRKHHIASTFHVFTKRPNDKYDIQRFARPRSGNPPVL